MGTARGRVGLGRSLLLVLLGAGLAAAAGIAALVFGGGLPDGGRLARACTPPLIDALRARGFEPTDLEFAAVPGTAWPFGAARLDSAFTFRDGAAGTRVDGVVACAVAGGAATVEVRVGAVPRRAA